MKGSSYSLRVMKNAKQYNKAAVPQHGTLLEVPLEGSPSVSSTFSKIHMIHRSGTLVAKSSGLDVSPLTSL